MSDSPEHVVVLKEGNKLADSGFGLSVARLGQVPHVLEHAWVSNFSDCFALPSSQLKGTTLASCPQTYVVWSADFASCCSSKYQMV
jgi:hypothetical protein